MKGSEFSTMEQIFHSYNIKKNYNTEPYISKQPSSEKRNILYTLFRYFQFIPKQMANMKILFGLKYTMIFPDHKANAVQMTRLRRNT